MKFVLQVAFDVHMHKDRSNENGPRKNIPPSKRITTKLQPVVNVKSENKENKENDDAFSQQKIGSRLPDIHHSKGKMGNNLNLPKSRDPVKLPELNMKSGNNSKVKCNARNPLILSCILHMCIVSQLATPLIIYDRILGNLPSAHKTATL